MSENKTQEYEQVAKETGADRREYMTKVISFRHQQLEKLRIALKDPLPSQYDDVDLDDPSVSNDQLVEWLEESADKLFELMRICRNGVNHNPFAE